MNDLFKKLNVLLKSGVHSVGQTEAPHGERQPEPPLRVGSSLEKEVAALRERINEAVRYEEELTLRVRQYEQEAARWDNQADDAVAQGNDASARYAIEQMRRAEQRAVMADADLRAHQIATQDLIQRVNTLESVVADALREQAAQVVEQQPTDEAPSVTPPENLHLPDLSNVLREAREKILSLSDLASAQREVNPTEPPEDDGETQIDDDLEARRQRLSKP
jgi:hypothetical protein